MFPEADFLFLFFVSVLGSPLALRLGLPFVPSYLGQAGTVEDMTHGVNYASAGAGVIFSSGSELVCFFSFPFFTIELSLKNKRNCGKKSVVKVKKKRKTRNLNTYS